MLKSKTFPKKEKLTGEIRINRLFAEGSSFIQYPLRVVYLLNDTKEDVSAKVLVSVPKKKIKLAVRRNRIKRLLREAYRLHKEDFCNELSAKGLTMDLGLIYLSEKETTFAEIETKMNASLFKLQELVKAETKNHDT